MNEKTVKLTAKLYEVRDSLRGLFPKSYQQKVDELLTELKTVAKEDQVDPFELAIATAKACQSAGDAVNAAWWLAVAVEVVEPGNPTAKKEEEQ